MSLSDLASLGGFVSGLAVLVSLVYLALQVRQTERNQQSSIRQARSIRTSERLMGILEPSVGEAMMKGIRGVEDLSDIELFQMTIFCRSSFYDMEDAFYQHRDGLLSDSAFKIFAINMTNPIRSIGTRAQWRLQRHTYGPEFVAWLDKLIADTEMQGPLTMNATWRTALAAERSGAPY